MKENFEIFLRVRPALIFVALLRENGKKDCTQIAKDSDCTYSHAVKILKTFKELGFITTKKNGRKVEVELTKKGREIAERINSVVYM